MQFRRRHRAGVLVAVLAAFGVAWFSRGPTGAAWPQLQAASTERGAAGERVKLGPNVLVSSDNAAVDHMGCALAADPSDPRRLFAASTMGDAYDNVVSYYSHDGGQTWRLACTRPHRPGEQVADEDVAFGPDGSLFFANMRTPRDTPGTYRYGTAGVGNIDFACSLDGGVSWEERASVPRYIDRPCLAVDCTSGSRRGRLYVHATVEEPMVLVSADSARTFSAGATLTPDVRSTRPSSPVVLADGAVLVTSAVFVGGSDAHLELPLWRSVDGGVTFSQVTPNLAGRWKHSRIKSSSVFDVFYPRLAVDPGSPKCAGRLFCVWRDGHMSDESYILFACSRDNGTTWSTPTIVSEQPAGPDAGPDYSADIPAIAVNKDGVVAVTWYDRRGLAKHVVGPDGVIAPVNGYDARVRISCDGGETWQPSVKLNATSINANRLEARHWTGLAATADGRFHATWIGDATGKRQVWTAAIEVRAPY